MLSRGLNLEMSVQDGYSRSKWRRRFNGFGRNIHLTHCRSPSTTVRQCSGSGASGYREIGLSADLDKDLDERRSYLKQAPHSVTTVVILDSICTTANTVSRHSQVQSRVKEDTCARRHSHSVQIRKGCRKRKMVSKETGVESIFGTGRGGILSRCIFDSCLRPGSVRCSPVLVALLP